MSNNYKNKSADELEFIIRDAAEVATFAKDLGNYEAEAKYLDQVNDACSELYKRRKQTYDKQVETRRCF